MAKKSKKISKTNVRIGIAVISIIFLIFFYFAIIEERFMVKEFDGFIEKPIISPKHPLVYETEFCANKLTDLAHEIHFLKKSIEQKEITERKLKFPPELEDKISKVEQRELSLVQKDFENYQGLCEAFDKNPTPELCSQFLEEAKHQLEITQEAVDVSEAKGITERLQLSFQGLRKAKRIYEGLQNICEITK